MHYVITNYWAAHDQIMLIITVKSVRYTTSNIGHAKLRRFDIDDQ